MQTCILAVFSLALSISVVSASVTVVVDTSGWGDGSIANGTADNNMPWGLLINTLGSTFDGSETATLSRELIGLVIPNFAEPSNPVAIGNSQYAFVRAISNSEGNAAVSGYFDQVVLNLNVAGVTSGDAVGLIWFNPGTQVVATNSTFGFQNLNQVLPADSTVADGGFGGSPTTMQYQTVPEPGLLGLTGLAALGLLRRRRR